jgi:four helix bundle protein
MNEEKEIIFYYEKLDVYQNSVEFITWLNVIIDSIKYNKNIIDQIDRASISLILNIAEGNGKSSAKEHNRYIDIARGSAMECAACLDIMYAKGIIEKQKLHDGKHMLLSIVRMLYKLSESILKKNKD